MLRGILLAVAMVGVAGCTPEAVQDTTRQAAKSVVTPIVEKKFPGRNAVAYSDCIIDNATTDEIFSLAKAGIVGVDDSTVATVVTISTRGSTLECFLRAELGGLGGRG